MSLIPVRALLDDFQMMLREHWSYGSDTRRGNVDCSGAFVWSYEQHGHDIYHGSNRIARTEVLELIPVAVAQIVPGMAAFKLRNPGDKYYALPSSYQPGGRHHNGDLNDYYHIGLVDEDTTRVLNAQGTSTGFVSSPIGQNWSHVAYLKQVDYGGKGSEMSETIKTAVVTADSGSTVNMRDKPNGKLVERVPVGTEVPVSGSQDGWSRIAHNGQSGWMMSQYLRMGGNSAPSETGTEEILRRLKDAERRLDLAETRLAALDGGLG